MRIVAGEFGGRRLKSLSGADVRPTTDRVREAWFSILGKGVAGAEVLDLCAGSGALGLEALSRGARAVTFVDRDPRSLRVLSENIATLGVSDRCRVVRQEALAALENLRGQRFDLVLADPPYQSDLAERLVTLFRETPFAAILSVEHDSALALEGDETRRYGNSAITFCQAP